MAVDLVSPAWRNALFTFIDLGIAYGALKRPPIMVVAMPLMFLQQLTTHVLHAWRLAQEGRIDWLSLAVLGFVFYAVVAVWMDRGQRKNL